MDVVNRKRCGVALLALVLVWCSSCGAREREAQLEELAQAKAKWESHNLSNYTMTIDQDCPNELSGPSDLVVEEGKVVAAYKPGTTEIKTEFVDGGREVDEWVLEHCYSTIPGLFHNIERRLERRNETVEIEYDADYGHPTSIVINESKRVADGAYLVDVFSFEPTSNAETTTSELEHTRGGPPR